jgi:retron-type reverse transcriptase
MILEAIYEPCFSKVSFGFRQGLGTHDALEHIEAKFRWVDWLIEGDIEGAYPTIDHKQLSDILSEKIDDVRFINLIRKLLKCGILRKEQFSREVLYHQFLQIFILMSWINGLKKKHASRTFRKTNQKNKRTGQKVKRIENFSKTNKTYKKRKVKHSQLSQRTNLY